MSPGPDDPFLLTGMDRAVTRLMTAVRDSEPITVYGDYDADGLTATALLVTALRESGARDVSWYIPDRHEEGYGLNRNALGRLRASGTRLVVTVDCGVTALAEAAFARRIGLDLIVTDHHEPGADLPPASAVVDPRLGGDESPFADLAGVGVALKVAQALRMALTAGNSDMPLFDVPAMGDSFPQALDLVALGTVTDVVPLLGENRSLVHRGLSFFNPPRRPGFKALRRVAGLQDREIGSYHLAFQFGPRLNAAGRMGDASRALRLLLTGDEDEAHELAAELDRGNRLRQEVEERILDEAVVRIEREIDLNRERAIVLAGEGWPDGVIGIVASRLVERYARPALLVAVNSGVGKGSGRSVQEFDLVEALSRCAGWLARYGGHRMAAGFEIEERSIDSFAEAFMRVARDRLAEEDLVRRLRIDAWVRPEELGASRPGSPPGDLLEELALLEPHGAGNPEPVFAMTGVEVLSPRLVGEGGRHLKATVRVGSSAFDAVGFGFGSLAPQLGNGQVDIAFRPGLDEWGGRRMLQLRLVDVRPAAAGGARV